MKANAKHSGTAKQHHKGYNKGTTHTSQSQNNIGTVGHISYQPKEGKGSFKKISERVEKKAPNIHGEGENQEIHWTKLPGM